MKTILRNILFTATMALILTGCGDRKKMIEKTQNHKELIIFSGGGLRNPIAEICEIFEKEFKVKVMSDYAGAEVLISKAKLSERGDIYIPGDRKYVEMAAKKGLILSHKSICYLLPTIFVQKGNPKKIKNLKDLIHPDIKIGLGNPSYIPIGCTSKMIFEKSGIPWKNIEKNLKFKSATVNELCLQIQAKSLDAVIVWDAVAHCYEKYGDKVAIPPNQNIHSTVNAGILKFTKNCALAEKFMELMLSKRGQAVFRKHKYLIEIPK